MKDEKILQDELLTDEELEKIVGGIQKLNDETEELVKKESPSDFDREKYEKMQEIIWGKV